MHRIARKLLEQGMLLLLLYGCAPDAPLPPHFSPEDSDAAADFDANASSIFETAAASSDRRARALSRALRASLKQLPGIADARIHLTLRDTSILSRAPRKESRAAILILPKRDSVPNISSIQDFVAAAVPDLSKDAVRVFIGDSRTPPEKLTTVGIFQVAERSAAPLKATLAVLLVLCILTAVALIAAGFRIRKLRAVPPAPKQRI